MQSKQLKRYMGVLLTASALSLSGAALAGPYGGGDDDEDKDDRGLPMQEEQDFSHTDRNDAAGYMDAQFEPPEDDEDDEDEGPPGF